MDNLKVSVITPVYNTEKYLDKTIESVINQTYKNLEFILIDDGSTDSSKKIILKHAKRDSRIKYFYKSNGGAASARNEGLRHVTGDYVFFIDSDDTIINNAIESLMEKTKSGTVDIVIPLKFKKFFTDGTYVEENLFDNSNKYYNLNDFVINVVISQGGHGE